MKRLVCLSVFLALAGASHAEQWLPVKGVVGLNNYSLAVPLDLSNAVLVQNPTGTLRTMGEDGDVSPPLSLPGPVAALETSLDETVVYTLTGEKLFAVERFSNSILAELDLSSIQAGTVWQLASSADSEVLVTWTQGIPNQTGTVVALDAATFQILRTVQGQEVSRSCVVEPSNEAFYFTRGAKEIVRVDISSGAESVVGFEPEFGYMRALGMGKSGLLAMSYRAESRVINIPYPPFTIVEEWAGLLLEQTSDGENIWGRGAVNVPHSLGASTLPGGRHVVSYGDGVHQVHRIRNSTPLLSFTYAPSIRGSHSGVKLAVGISDEETALQVYQLDSSAELLFSVPGRRYLIGFLGGPDGQFIGTAVGGENGIYDADGNLLHPITLIEGCSMLCGDFRAAAWVPGMNLLLSGGYSLRVWDTETGEVVKTLFPGNSSATIQSMAALPDGSKILFAKLIEPPPCTWCGPTPSTLEITSAPDLLTNAWTNRITIPPPTAESYFTSALFSPDGQNAYAIALSSERLADDQIVRYSSTDGQMLGSVDVVRFNPWEAPTRASLTISPDGRSLAFGVSGISEVGRVQVGSIRIYNAETMELVRTLVPQPTRKVEFSADGNYLIVGSLTDLQLVDFRTGGVLARSAVFGSGAEPVWALQDDGSTLAVGANDTLTYFSLDIPATRALPPREAFLAGAADPLSRDRNGDGILDAADLVEPDIVP